MRAGFMLPSIGPLASPSMVVRVAQQAEELGYDSLWVTERLLYPLKPQTPYPGSPDGSLPEQYKRNFDPVETLVFVAAHTSRIALGTSVLDMPYYNPVMLARRLTTLDVLSGGRLRVGLGQGWSKDEYDAAGASFKGRGRRAEEFIQVLKAIWTTDPVEFHGRFFQVPRSIIQPKPVQKPHPPIYLAAYAPDALKRAATLADGWHPVGLPSDALRQMTSGLKSMAKAAGRDQDSVEVIVRANVTISERAAGDQRWMFTGTLEEIAGDIKEVQELGADELIFDPTFSPDSQSEDRFIRNLERLRKLV
jgi:probable F420-dependent oxidoreductase